jgi:hypothetical protein
LPDAAKRSASITPAVVGVLAPTVVATLKSVAVQIPPGPAADLARTCEGRRPARAAGALLAERREDQRSAHLTVGPRP